MSDPTDGTPLLPFERQRPTSIRAAAEKAPTAGTDRERVRLYILGCGTAGATDDQIEAALGLRHQNASARRRDLCLRGEVVWCGATRATRSGRQANVWLAHQWAAAADIVPLPPTHEERVAALKAEIASLRAELERRDTCPYCGQGN